MANSIPVYTNRTQTATLGAVTDEAPTITLQDGDGAKFPALTTEQYMPAVIVNPVTGVYEEIDITGKTGDVLDVVRGKGGTTAQAWGSNATLFVDVPARELDLMRRTWRLSSSETAQILVDGSPVLTVDGATGDITSEWFEFDQSENNVVLRPDHNATDASTSTLTGVGTASFPNLIGDTGKPAGADFTPTGWVDDSGYVAGAASVATISGGYDHVVNGIAGTVCGGGHNFIRYTAGGHNTIGGGSYNIIHGIRSGIFSGRRNTINQAGGNGEGAAFNFIGGGDDNEITGASGTFGAIIGCGAENEVAADYGAIVGGFQNEVLANYGLIGSGNGNTVSGSYASVITGLECSVGFSFSHAVGRENTAAHQYCFLTGRGGRSQGANNIVNAAGAMVEQGDAQTISSVMSVRTTDATLTNMSAEDGTFIDLPDDKVSAGTARILLVGMRDGSADANNDGDYTQVAYELTCGFYWDGTNGFLFSGSTQTAVTSAPTLNMTALSANTNNDFTPGATPHVAINTGALRVKVTGIASTIINWVARIDLAVTRVS